LASDFVLALSKFWIQLVAATSQPLHLCGALVCHADDWSAGPIISGKVLAGPRAWHSTLGCCSWLSFALSQPSKRQLLFLRAIPSISGRHATSSRIAEHDSSRPEADRGLCTTLDLLGRPLETVSEAACDSYSGRVLELSDPLARAAVTCRSSSRIFSFSTFSTSGSAGTSAVLHGSCTL